MKKGESVRGGRTPKGKPGRPHKIQANYAQQLREALKFVEDEKRKSFLVEVCRKAYYDNAIMATLLKKLVPDLSHLDLETKKGMLINIIENYKPEPKPADAKPEGK